MYDPVSTAGVPLVADSQGAVCPEHDLRIEFTGSGSEYFRIWIVNQLLVLLTLGLYFPWAKARRLRYFYGHTLVGGEPLGFHGDPRKMLKGFLLVAALLGLYSVAHQFSDMAGFAAFLIVAAIWPALLRSSMQFRLANTSWRGLRFRFKGSLGAAYRVVLPVLLTVVAIVGAVMAASEPDKRPDWHSLVGSWMTVTWPWLLWRLTQYQHNHYALASLQTSFTATLGSFYKVFLKASVLMSLAVMPLVVALVALVTVPHAGQSGDGPSSGAATRSAVFVLLVVVAMFVVIKPYLTSRLQNLVWSRTGNASLRFLSDLRFKLLLWLTAKNWLLMIVTLGLYWPFAAVALARMRLEAVSVQTRVSPDNLVNEMQGAEGEAAGDAAGDMFGFDIGF